MPESGINRSREQQELFNVFYQPDAYVKALELYLSENPKCPQYHAIRNKIVEYIKFKIHKNLKNLCQLYEC